MIIYLRFPDFVMTLAQRRLLHAASRAWAFGAMCSWNDLRFADDKLGAEYESVPNRLYKAVNVVSYRRCSLQMCIENGFSYRRVLLVQASRVYNIGAALRKVIPLWPRLKLMGME